MSNTIESVLHETRVFPPSEAFQAQATISGMAAYKALCAKAEADYEGFWAELARAGLFLPRRWRWRWWLSRSRP